MLRLSSPMLLRTRRAGPGMRALICSSGILHSRPATGRGVAASSVAGQSPCPPPPAGPAGPPPSAAERAEAVMTAYQEMIQEQLEDGLRAIQHTANTLMHEIAAEGWRSAGGAQQDGAGTHMQGL